MKNYTDFITIPLGLALWYLVDHFGNKIGLHMFGVEPFQKLFLGLCFTLIMLGVSMLILKVRAPWLYEAINRDDEKTKEWEQFSSKEKTVIGLCFFALIFLCYVLTVANL